MAGLSLERRLLLYNNTVRDPLFSPCACTNALKPCGKEAAGLGANEGYLQLEKLYASFFIF